jgi:hypothetical protein
MLPHVNRLLADAPAGRRSGPSPRIARPVRRRAVGPIEQSDDGRARETEKKSQATRRGTVRQRRQKL